MNREETKKAIAVMQAYVDGKQIEAAQEGSEWRASLPIWDWGPNEYRVKPEPIECWVTIFNGHVCSTCHDSEESASHITDKPNWTVRKFREVIE